MRGADTRTLPKVHSKIPMALRARLVLQYATVRCAQLHQQDTNSISIRHNDHDFPAVTTV